jgi:hypothetical protein
MSIALMQIVRREAGERIRQIAAISSAPAAFWAALTANESGVDLLRGKPHREICRREKQVFAALCLVAGGFDTRYGQVHLEGMGNEVAEEMRPATYHEDNVDVTVRVAKQAIGQLLTIENILRWASSWGYTQLMGYHCLRWGDATVEDLRNPDVHYRLAARLLAGECQRFGVDMTREFEAMGRIWNAGRPDGKTYLPGYIPDLMRRMEIWKGLP